jgi:zinc transport system ATP-binding protein
MNLAREILVSASGISVSQQGRPILDGVSLSVQRGQIVTLIGPNGAGKTTLVKSILGLLKPDVGEIERQPGIRIGYMPQRLQLSENLPLTVRRFLDLGCTKRVKATCFRWPGYSISAICWSAPYSGYPAVSISECCWHAHCCASPICWCWTNRFKGWMSPARQPSTA